MYIELLDKLVDVGNLAEAHGEVVVPRAGSKSHNPNHVLGVFWFDMYSGKLDYLLGNVNHNQFSDYQTYVKQAGMLRGRLAKDDYGKAFIFLYVDDFPNWVVPGNTVVDIHNKICSVFGKPVSYVVDEMGRDLVEHNLKND